MPGMIFCVFFARLSAILFFGIVVFAVADNCDAQEKVDFAHDILPILKSRCAECHSNGVFKGGLSLETREKLIDADVVETGSHQDSDLFQRIISDDPDEQMPPEGERLTEAQVKLFERWIDSGITWPAELSLKKPKFKRLLELNTVELLKTQNGSTHAVDRILEDYFRSSEIQPPKRLSDSQFIRRAKLDLLGRLPTVEEIELFVASSDSGKHEKLIDELLSRDRDYADHWMSFWNDLLRNDYTGTGFIDGGRKQITNWLHRSLIENKAYDQMVRELISPSAESAGFIKGIKWRGRVNASQVEPLQFSQNISQVFLGINMKCASCHDSFIDDWKLADAYGLAAITADKPLELHRCDVPTGETATSKFVFPSVGEIDGSLSRTERLAQLATLMTSKKNGRFPRTIVNRLWHRMTGRGLVHPVDVMANEAWSEPLLNFLAVDLVNHDYDLKRTMRLIATSGIYRSQSAPVAESVGEFVFRGIEAKRVTAEQFVDGVWELTGAAPGKVAAAIHVPGNPPAGNWIWADKAYRSAPAGEVVTFKVEFELAQMPKYCNAVAACDNSVTLFLNGEEVGTGKEWNKPAFIDLKKGIRVGKNVLLAKAANGGESPNPAALFLEVNIDRGSAQPSLAIVSDDSFQWVRQSVDHRKIPDDLDWQPAVVLADASQLYKSAEAEIKRAVARLRRHDNPQVRASLVNSDFLMRSLGRPNREQVVTTRPADLSTLQALDLSNGEILTGWLRIGAKKWLAAKHENQWTDQELVSRMFWESLSRDATARELELLTPLEVAAGSSSESEPIEDLLWMIVMLPEFQLVE